MKRAIKQILKIFLSIVFLIAVAYVTLYAYLILQFTFVWQCKVYTGELTAEGERICQNYREGGLLKVLTN